MNHKILWPVLAVLVIGLVAIFYPRRATEPPAPPELPAPAPVEAPEETPFLGPEPEPEPPPPFVEEPPPDAVPPPPPPPIEEREPEARAALAQVAGAELVEEHLVRDDLVRKLVATVDNLASEAIWINSRVVPAQEGLFQVEGTEEEELYISPANYRRYTALVQLVDAVDTNELAQAYKRFYPLLQQAYEELGYPGRQFHNRALEVIDHLLETPVVEGPIPLQQPHVLYEYADPELEALSSGQKAFIRLGPEHGETIRRKLIEFRAAIEELDAAPADG
jgi:hypothetical protein